MKTDATQTELKPTNTVIKKGFRGWQGKSLFLDVINGKDFELTTMKRSNGQICATFQAGKHEQGENYSCFKYTMFEDQSGILLNVAKNATEKTIKAIHTEALEIFKNKFNSSQND